MFKRTKEVAQQVADAIAPPTTAQARAAVEQRRQELVDAQARTDQLLERLAEAEDAQADQASILEREAELVSARLDAERAQRALESAQRRLATAEKREHQAAAGTGRARLVEIIADRERAAQKIADALVEIKAGVTVLDASDEALAALQAAGHVTRNLVLGYSAGPSATRARLEIELREIVSGPATMRPASFADWITLANNTALAG